MTRIEQIEKEVRSLSREELAQFREWFAMYDADAWDAQIEQDVAAGKLDSLAQEAIAEYRRGEAKEL